ncbi:MAG: hypothetical protein Q9218_004804 [Villophora microphyllina]
MAPAEKLSAARRKSGEVTDPDPRSGEEDESESQAPSATRFSPEEETKRSTGLMGLLYRRRKLSKTGTGLRTVQAKRMMAAW